MIQEITVYLIATAILVAAILSFFRLARGGYRQLGPAQLLLRIASALPLLASAVWVHFLHTNEATSMLPEGIPATGLLVRLSGVFEILGAIGLFVPQVRRSSALWIAILMVLVFPVNVFIAGQTFFGFKMPNVPVRLIGQMVYIWIVLLAGYGLPSRAKRENQV